MHNRLCAVPKPAPPKPALVPSLNLPLQNRPCAYAKPAAPKPALRRPLTCRSKTGFASTLNQSLQNRLCDDSKHAFSFWIIISTASEVRCDCQGLGLVARIEASILVFDAMKVLFWPVLGQIQFCSLDRRCKTCLDTKPVLYQDRFPSLTMCHCKEGACHYFSCV